MDLRVNANGKRSLRAQHNGNIGGATCARPYGRMNASLRGGHAKDGKRKAREPGQNLEGVNGYQRELMPCSINNHICNPPLAALL